MLSNFSHGYGSVCYGVGMLCYGVGMLLYHRILFLVGLGASFFYSPLFGVITIFQALRPVEKPDYVLYVEDDIRGAKWRWGWIGNRLSNLWCYCPDCEAVLVYRYDLIFEETHFLCENCRHSVVATIKGGDKDYALRAVEREIDRRIRTGEYKSKLNNSNYRT